MKTVPFHEALRLRREEKKAIKREDSIKWYEPNEVMGFELSRKDESLSWHIREEPREWEVVEFEGGQVIVSQSFSTATGDKQLRIVKRFKVREVLDE